MRDVMRILLLEEDREGREALSRILKKIGFTVLPAENPPKALQMLKSVMPLNLMIAGATDRDRTEFLSDMRVFRRNLPVIFLTDYCAPESMLRSRLFGAFLVSRALHFYINTRPISLNELCSVICIATRRERDGREQVLAA